MFIAVFNKKESVDKIFAELEIMGYQTEEISVIAKLDPNEVTNTINTQNDDLTSGEISSMEGILISGPLVVILSLSPFADPVIALTKEGDTEEFLKELLINLGIPYANAEYFSQIAGSGGIILIVPEYEPKIQEILRLHGAQNITVVENVTNQLKGRM